MRSRRCARGGCQQLAVAGVEPECVGAEPRQHSVRRFRCQRDDLGQRVGESAGVRDDRDAGAESPQFAGARFDQVAAFIAKIIGRGRDGRITHVRQWHDAGREHRMSHPQGLPLVETECAPVAAGIDDACTRPADAQGGHRAIDRDAGGSVPVR